MSRLLIAGIAYGVYEGRQWAKATVLEEEQDRKGYIGYSPTFYLMNSEMVDRFGKFPGFYDVDVVEVKDRKAGTYRKKIAGFEIQSESKSLKAAQ